MSPVETPDAPLSTYGVAPHEIEDRRLESRFPATLYSEHFSHVERAIKKLLDEASEEQRRELVESLLKDYRKLLVTAAGLPIIEGEQPTPPEEALTRKIERLHLEDKISIHSPTSEATLFVVEDTPELVVPGQFVDRVEEEHHALASSSETGLDIGTVLSVAAAKSRPRSRWF